MKTKLFILSILVCFTTILSAQVLTMPTYIEKGYNDEIIVYFNPTSGNGGMADATKCYAHTGIITSESTSDSDWKYVIDDWRGTSSKGRLTKEGGVWKLVIPDIYNFYGCPKSTTIKKIAFVFHDGPGGNKEGKAEENKDIFISIASNNLTKYGKCGDNLNWAYNYGMLVIGGSGDMYHFNIDNNKVPWYSDNSTITNIILQRGITNIGDYAFSDCSSLSSFTIPNSVMSIGSSAFSYCSSLTSITIPNSVTSIGSSAFHSCSSLASITIPNSITSIGDNAFQNCSSLTSITIPNSVTSIGSQAFRGCSSLTSVTIPNSVTSIGDKVFAYCSSLTSITIPEGVTTIGDYAFQNCSSLTSITIPNSVTSIGSQAFAYCGSLTSVTIPNSVTSIGSRAFWNCSSLTSVTIPNSVTSIGSSAFSGCSALTSITIPNSVTSIGDYAFFGCSSLTSITIPNSVTSIGGSTFFGCSALTSITIPNSVTSIGSSAFYGCSALTTITIPNSVTSIEWGAFEGCSSLTSVTIQEGVKAIKYDTFKGCTSLTSITIPNSVTSIGSSAFSGCSALTSITIPNSVTSIGSEAFQNCLSLTSITMSNGITNIEESTFKNCKSLLSITIPENVTQVKSNAFLGCTSLKSIFWNATKITDFSSIESSPFHELRSNINSFVFGEAVQHIPAYLCYNMDNLTNIKIGQNTRSVGNEAFANCDGLSSICLPKNINRIGAYAFLDCLNLTSITCEAVFLPTLKPAVFLGIPTESTILYVPEISLEDYQFAEQWQDFATILPIEGTSKSDYECVEYTIVSCDYYEWHGEICTISGDYTYITTSEDGHLVLETLHLTIERLDFKLSSAETIVQNEITIEYSIANGQTEPAWYEAGLRLYKNNTITISSSASAITSIIFDWEKQGDKTFAIASASVGAYSHPKEPGKGIWEGAEYEIVFTIGTGQLQLNTLSVLACDLETPTEVENVSSSNEQVAKKLLRNGQLLILRDGKTYSVIGQKVE